MHAAHGTDKLQDSRQGIKQGMRRTGAAAWPLPVVQQPPPVGQERLTLGIPARLLISRSWGSAVGGAEAQAGGNGCKTLQHPPRA